MTGRPYYWDYLRLDRVLDSQELLSGQQGPPAHDEMLFVIVHQAFELWFKQILWELDDVIEVMGRPRVDEHAVGRVVRRLDRIREIQPLLVQQLEVLETMTPLDFLDFRDLLVPASGFQSVQFRLIENRLGLDPDSRLSVRGSPYTARLSAEHAELLRESEEQVSLLEAVDAWLARTPFLHSDGWEFWRAYRRAVDRMLDRDRRLIADNPSLDEAARAQQLEGLEVTAGTFETLFDPERYDELVERGERRLSRRAFLGALFIALYRDEPVVQLPHRLLTALVDIDEGLTAWRHRHALLVHRMIGRRIGTGGTSGVDYLRAAAERHRVFVDLFDLATFLLPRSELPPLPDDVRREMGFRWSGQ